ncbi:hypothetical protein ACN429_25820 (plasmid) [Pseudomonas oryzihabitans]|uniref:hypothetical protein n=1 Tax=Pseudomonas oryzihabitans TaxID=47885 RepID=UPI003B2234DA
MRWNDLERHFSAARLRRYLVARAGDEALAAADYSANLRLAEAMMPMLNTLEIALRNGINAKLTERYQRQDWWAEWRKNPLFTRQLISIKSAVDMLGRRNEDPLPDKVLAELTFGFWVSLFNTDQTPIWKELRLVFPSCPKPLRQRKNISKALNQVRSLRNRVFHHEPLLWLTPELIDQHRTGVQVIGWLAPELADWLNARDRLPSCWRDWKNVASDSA